MARVLGLFFISLALISCGPRAENYSFGKLRAGAFSQSLQDQYSALLQRYVAADGSSVNYSAWRSNAADLAALKQVAQAIGDEDVSSLSGNRELAFLLNAYNILTIDLILSNYDDTVGGAGRPFPSGRSIRNIQNLDFEVWNNLTFSVGGALISLNALENDRIRSFNDARIHFAINCASVGCPPLLTRAFTAENLDAELDFVARSFVNSGKEQQTIFDFTTTPPTIRTSEILSRGWFRSDFENDPKFGSVAKFFKTYVDPAIVANPDDIDGFRIRHSTYNWALNETP